MCVVAGTHAWGEVCHHNNSPFTSAHPWHPEQRALLKLPCECTGLQSLERHYTK